MDVANMTPLEAINVLYELQQKAQRSYGKGYKAQDKVNGG